jgi:hypothetical protein
MGGVCTKYDPNERYIQGFGRENLEERHHLEDQGIDGWKILQGTLKKEKGWGWT